MIEDVIQQECKNLQAEIILQVNNAITNHIPSQTNSYATNDDDLPTEKVSQKLMAEMSKIVDEAKLRKFVNEMLRQRCTSGDEHQYHIDQTCQRDPKAIALSLCRIFENPHENIFYIKIPKEPQKPKEVVYSNLKIVQVIKTYWELRYEHKFITEIIARRANGSIVSITEPNYKNLNKNDIEDMYLLIVNDKVDDYAETGLLWSLSVLIRSIVIWERNSKKEKRVMRHHEIHKLCDDTLNRVLEGLKSYNNNVKHGYVTSSLSKGDDEYLQLFEEEIEERLKHHDHMRR
ncbi:hypothetical protein Tco_1076304 [Tanacetum coccineum]